jgi:hypothetical protein
MAVIAMALLLPTYAGVRGGALFFRTYLKITK